MGKQDFYRPGKTVAEFRRLRGFTQRRLADKSGVPAGTIARIELGHFNPSDDTLRDLALALEIEPQALGVTEVVA